MIEPAVTGSAPTALEAALPLLQCPHCRAALRGIDRNVVGCDNGHRFDIARQGYVSLLGNRSRTDTGDSAEMVAARVEFLAAGHYLPIAEAVASAVQRGPVVEIGAGTGYYLAAVLDRLTRRGQRAVGVALDSSRYAARRAAAAHPAMASVVADAWSALPLRDGAAGAVLSVFAPRDPAEIVRVLAADGVLVVVTPEPEHLSEIRSILRLLAVDAGKAERLSVVFAEDLEVVEQQFVRREMSLTPADVSALVRMGPSARHLSGDELAAAVGTLPGVTVVTLAVTVSVLRAASGRGHGSSSRMSTVFVDTTSGMVCSRLSTRSRSAAASAALTSSARSSSPEINAACSTSGISLIRCRTSFQDCCAMRR